MMMSSVPRPDPLSLITSLPPYSPASQRRARSSQSAGLESHSSSKPSSQSDAHSNKSLSKSAVGLACLKLSAVTHADTQEKLSTTVPATRSSAAPLMLCQLNGRRTPASSAAVATVTTSRRATTPDSPTPRSSRKLGSPRTPTRNFKSSRDLHTSPASRRGQLDHTAKSRPHLSASPARNLNERVCLKIPQKLPPPQLCPNSSPHKDLVGHLFRHNLLEEAREAHNSTMPPEYMLDAFLSLGQRGSTNLYQQAQLFLSSHQQDVSDHIKPGQSMPESVSIDVSDMPRDAQLAPTHLLAVHSSDSEATIYAVHSLVIALQCVSIPFFPFCQTKYVDGRTVRDLPVVDIKVPQQSHFGIILRWLYSQSPTTLAQDLMPIPHIVRYLTLRSIEQGKSQLASSTSAPSRSDLARITSQDLVEAMSVLPTRALLEILKKIQVVWKNGVALGIYAPLFWNQLDRTWELVINAMVHSKHTRKAQPPQQPQQPQQPPQQQPQPQQQQYSHHGGFDLSLHLQHTSLNDSSS